MKTKQHYLIALMLMVIQGITAQTTLIPTGSSWKYLDNGSNQGTNWTATTFDDASWASGNAQLGYGDGDEATVVSYGPSSTNKYITTYFRKTFTLTNPTDYVNYTLKVRRDDGVVVYINGTEVYRNNMPTGTIAYNTGASTACSDDGGSFLTATLTQSAFVAGTNTIAVEIHQNNGSSSDVSFDLSLEGNTTAATTIKHIRWGSNKNPLEGLTINWRNTGTADKIKWGYTTSYEQGEFNGVMRTGYADKFFKYTFPTVTADATIYYQLYDSQAAVWTAQKTYRTAPPVNTTNFSFLAIGDSRSGMSIWNQVSTLAHSKNAAFTIFNGDIVNDGGSISDWDSWFDNGKTFVENNLVFHSLGNHDAASVPDYQNNFELPKSVPTTGTTLYYAVDYGNAVFISLNSESPNDTAQYNWLISTLQANVNKRWKVVFFHKPFYTIGSHAGEMNSYFNTWWKAFDDYGVDLVVNGHDHMYERTKPINRNVSTTAAVTNYGSGATDGRCQIVCGGAGAPLYAGTPTWFIQSYQSKYNFCKMDVTDNSLCVTSVDQNDVTIDSFCINKTTLGTATGQTFNPIKVVPNPVTDIFTLDYQSADLGEVNIRIYDMNGRLVAEEKAQKQQTNFTFRYNMSKFQKGVYNLEITVGKQKDTSLIVVK
ncbi:T9SS type A sorting domain-containing protein [Flavobacterium pedocola]